MTDIAAHMLLSLVTLWLCPSPSPIPSSLPDPLPIQRSPRLSRWHAGGGGDYNPLAWRLVDRATAEGMGGSGLVWDASRAAVVRLAQGRCHHAGSRGVMFELICSSNMGRMPPGTQSQDTGSYKTTRVVS